MAINWEHEASRCAFPREGERIVAEADNVSQLLGRYVSSRIDSGMLRIVAVSALTADVRVAIETAFGPLKHGVIIVAERQP